MRASWRAWLAWASVCVLWGTTGPAIRIAVRSMPPFLQGGVRFTIAGLLLAGTLVAAGRRLPRDASTWRDILLVSVLLALANGLFSTGFIVVTGAVGTLVVCTVAIWMSALEALRPGGQRPGPLGVAGLAVGLAGVAVLVPWERGLGWSCAWSYVVLLIAALVWSASAVYQRHRRFSERLDPFLSAGLQCLLAGIVMCLIGLAVGELPRWHPTREGLVALVYLMVFGSLVGFASFIYMLEKLPADVVGLYTYINPLVAAGVDFLVVREAPGVRFWIAAALVLAGVSLVRRSERGKGRSWPRPTQ
jgi:drug/metabolite transporter (DMT)-like permease